MLQRALNTLISSNTVNALASSNGLIYDAVVHIGKLNDLLKDGWKVTTPELSEASEQRSKLHYNDSLLVGILGSYNRGKSFLLNKLCKTQFPNGRLISTEGISIAGPRDTCKNLVFIDTAGTDTPTKREDLDDKRAIEALLREIVLGLCSYIIIVMNRLQLTDQIYMHEVLEYCSKLSPQERPEIIFIHNLWDLECEDDVTTVIEKEIQEILGAKSTTIQQRNDEECKEFQMFSSTFNQIPIRHFIMSKDGSPSGNNWNVQSLDSLMSILQADIPRRRSVDILDEILVHINKRLPRLLSSNNSYDIDLSKIKAIKHEEEPYIVLSELKKMPLKERKQHDSSLSVSPKLLYDQRGYLVGIVSAGTEKWQPRYRQYKTAEYLIILVEVAGFNENNLSVEMEKNVVVVRGERVELEGSSCVLISDQLQYPIGSFELLISVADDIDSDKTQFDCKDGLLTVTCPLRKYAKKRFGQSLTQTSRRHVVSNTATDE
jgi:HSP20 family molecular chaperone IbpA/GTPase SAR1 family protein